MEELITSNDITHILNTPLQDLQLNAVSLLVLSMLVGRIVTYLKNNGGIKNILRAIWEGGITGSKTQRKVDEVNTTLQERIKVLEERVSKTENSKKDS